MPNNGLDIPTLGTLFLSYDAVRFRGRVAAWSEIPTVAAGDWAIRSDLGLACYYDGTRWLTLHEYTLPLKLRSAGGAPTDTRIRTDYAPYLTAVSVATNVAAPNNATNYYTVAIQSANLALGAADNLFVFNTSGDAAATEVAHDTTAPAQPATNRSFLRYTHLIGAGAPGAITSSATVYYRLIIT